MAAAFEALATDNLLASRSREALDRHLTDTLDVGGIAVVTGEAGAGKTAAVRAFVRALDPRGYLTVALVSPLGNPRALLRAILSALGETPEWATPDALSQLSRLVMPWHEQGRHLLVVIDEAQDLPGGVLLFLRSLLQTPLGDRLPVRVVLIGTPSLSAKLRVQAMEPVAQRVTSHSQILGFTREETRAYLEREAAAAEVRITAEASELIFQRSRAIPRVVTTVGRLSQRLAQDVGEIRPEHVVAALEEAQIR
jgi:type II secretory pathway predicted ATPase ExeA